MSRFAVRNDDISAMSRVRAGMSTLWNRDMYERLRRRLRLDRPAVVHFHNTFPLLSPAVYYAAARERVPVVQTLHNFRLLCINGLLMRDGRVCEDCLGRPIGWPGVLHRCYRDDRLASATVVAMQVLHRSLGSWRKKVDRFIAASAFSRGKLVSGGLPAGKIVVKPNFVDPDPGVGAGGGGYALFVGRLSVEKGIGTLLKAWTEGDALPPLRIVGAGPLAGSVSDACAGSATIDWLGSRTLSEVLDLVGDARFVIVPSVCYENFPRVIAESFAKGTPVIASNHGSLAEIVHDIDVGFLSCRRSRRSREDRPSRVGPVGRRVRIAEDACSIGVRALLHGGA